MGVCVVYYGDDDGGVGAGEGEVGDALAGCAGGPGLDVWFGGLGGGYLGRVWQVGDVVWGAGAFEAAVDGDGWVAALGAEGVAEVPVEELAGFGVDGGWEVVSVG